MQIKRKSYFKDKKKDFEYLESWAKRLEAHSGRNYERIQIDTAIGRTHVWGINAHEDLKTLVIFPGARTSSLFWDLDRGLDNLNLRMKIFLVETNGLPNFSDGKTPDIKMLDYGHWANEVLEKLGVERAFIAGASFGGLVCMKLGITNPERVHAFFLLNPGCLQPFSMRWKNLYYNLLPIMIPTEKNVAKFLDKAVFFKPNHKLSFNAEKLLLDYELFAIKRYKDSTQKPYYMDGQLSQVKADVYLIEGDKDLLFPYQKSIDHAKKHIGSLKGVEVFENVGHGIESYGKAINYIGEKINTYN